MPLRRKNYKGFITFLVIFVIVLLMISSICSACKKEEYEYTISKDEENISVIPTPTNIDTKNMPSEDLNTKSSKAALPIKLNEEEWLSKNNNNVDNLTKEQKNTMQQLTKISAKLEERAKELEYSIGIFRV